MIHHSQIIKDIDLDSVSLRSKNYFYLHLVSNALGLPVYLPLMIAKGNKEGPVLGLTAAVHGDEVNGTQTIQRLFEELEVDDLKGTIIAIPIVNIPAYEEVQRKYTDGEDLNRIMPGKENGSESAVYAHRFVQKIVSHFNYLLDLHTASDGRINSYYIRANLKKPITRRLAELQDADIIVHNTPSDGTLRGTASEMGIPAITIEVGNPNTFQKKMIKSGMVGIYNVMSHLEMTRDTIETDNRDTVVCSKSYWIYTDAGGLLTVYPELTQKIKKGDLIAIIRDVFGNIIKEYYAPEDGIVIGKSKSPANKTGGRILHLGIIDRNGIFS
ncbi:succinylglutamate desuccinylase/aspartoacylase family protein [Membranihabitans maritimus]|uniref:succinylglutamate desuccinylase/aspartoacylase family protein n=1 Tax=Membranihabitans maritimus TaxID=2904244 RepID=UPI001F3DE072|nr:succinylglutamate desuccinylase/aspartoacylase family protein [Membranihabitans maritimus]